MVAGPWLIVLIAASPPLVVEGGLEPRQPIRVMAEEAWAGFARTYERVTGTTSPVVATAIRIAPAAWHRPAESGVSQLGRIEVSQPQPGAIDDTLVLTLRHEMAHQFLLTVCPAAFDDRLFHEAFAMAASGEVEGWMDGPYVTTAAARKLLDRTLDLDAPDRRRALARLLKESWATGADLPEPLVRRLQACAAGSSWKAPLTLVELGSVGSGNVGNALVALSRHSGEVLIAEGEATLPMPFGSTLKPFLLAGARGPPPVLESQPSRPEWQCGEELPRKVTAETALLRSCNGYFLDWERESPAIINFGPYGPLLLRLGLDHLPKTGADAIGALPTLMLSPWALAQAYRALAATQPDLLRLMRKNAEIGTLSGLEASSVLAKFATKTGTVRDSQSRPLVGWIVAVSDDLVVVKTVKERMPRQFASELVQDLARVARISGQRAASVQVFGLVPSWQVEAKCEGVGVSLSAPPNVLPTDFYPLMKLGAAGPVICLGAPFRVRVPGSTESTRAYAGSFAVSLLPPPRASDGTTLREERARRGADILFTTSVGRYTAGVLVAEDGALTGEARIALGQVIAHNVNQHRHGERPICDTTHCQVFQGTAAVRDEDARIFIEDPLAGRGWLNFSRGGNEPWEEARTFTEVSAILGDNPTDLRFAAGRVRYQRTAWRDDEIGDEGAELACELLRSPLKLPSCPQSARIEPDRVVFRGMGRGHGQGLEVEWAKKCGLKAPQILQQAYGAVTAR